MLLDLLQETTLDEQTCDTEIALRQQVSKMEEIRPGILTDVMLSSLRKSHVLSGLIFITISLHTVSEQTRLSQ